MNEEDAFSNNDLLSPAQLNHNEFNINPGLDIKTLSRKKSIGAGTDLLDESSNKSLVSLR